MEKQDIIRLAREEMAACPLNNFGALGAPEDKIWVDVQGGFGAGNDPLFAFYKQDIGDFFQLPSEVFNTIYPGANKKDEDLTVVSLVCILDDKTREQQREGSGKEPPIRWLYARNSWNGIIKDFCTKLTAKYAENGIRAAAVDLFPGFKWVDTEKYGKASSFSHRHAAYICGNGTFGLCDGLISRWGKAVRYSTFILDCKLEPDVRPYKDYHDWCLFYAKGHCDRCIKACPYGAITPEGGHDKTKCIEFAQIIRQKNLDNPALDPNIEFGCGLCQGDVPCQTRVPKGLWPEDPRFQD